jgi:hypothetical protein
MKPYTHFFVNSKKKSINAHQWLVLKIKQKFVVQLSPNNRQLVHCLMTLPLWQVQMFNLRTSFARCKTSHLDPCKLIEDAHPSYVQIIF